MNDLILTVTPNSALDRVLFIDAFIPGADLRADKVVESPGGKGLDASLALRALGAPTLALGFAGGLTGQRLARLLDEAGVPHDLVWVGGETRTADVVVERRYHRQTHLLAPGYRVTPEEAEALLDRLSACLPQAGWMITGGSLPAGLPLDFYAGLTRMARQAGVPALLDASGEALRRALPARPEVVKMNRRELQETFGLASTEMASLVPAARAVARSEGLPALVVTCGEAGILAVLPEGVYLASCPAQVEVNSAGAGDAASAALAWRLGLGDPWPEALRWAAAASAAVVLTEGTAECHPGDVERLLGQAGVRESKDEG